MQPSPSFSRVGIRDFTFEACTGFTHVMARRVARPPKAAFVTRLRSGQLPNPTARQLPDLSTTIWVEPSSTGDPRHRGALNGETYRARIERKLTQAFSPVSLEITGQNPLGESHFSIFIVSGVFAGKSAVARHREIYRVLADELHERVHALSLQALSLEEHTNK